MKEADLYPPVKSWLEDSGYEVYSEVKLKHAGMKRADIVARLSPATTIVELKTTLSIDLVEQAFFWKRFAHYIYIAIPKRKKPLPTFIEKLLRDNKIGVLEVDLKRLKLNPVVKIPAKYNRPIFKKYDWDDQLLPEHQTWVPGGSAGGGYVTTYRLTMQDVKTYLKRQRRFDKQNDGWLMIKDILDHCETHYRNPKSSLSKALRTFEHEWCECKKEKGRLWFRYKGEEQCL